MALIEISEQTEIHNWLVHHIHLQHLKSLLPYINGVVLDVGCGVKPYKHLIEPISSAYWGIEYSQTSHGFSEVDIVASALDLPIKNNAVDTVVSFEVMEHVPEPEQYLREIFRVIKPGGYVILTTPFMWGEHESPYDFFRYTRYGIKYLAEKTGFTVVSIKPKSRYWTTAVSRFNYYLLRFTRGPLKYLFSPIYILDQLMALLLDKFPHNYTIDTFGFTTLLKKP